ncbi:MAG: glycosyltransferase [Acidobacteria bacterium]|nr:glycosyltransferase [Acidobacteriota bacterium]MBI3422774.1 glycosyltransferase [Acidobacteriota bacterium]
MRILWVKAGKLLPVDTGGKIRSYNILKHLAARHELTLLSYYGGPRDMAYEQAIQAELPGTRAVHTGAAEGNALDYLRRLPSPAPYAVSKFTDREVRRIVTVCLQEQRYDVAVCDFLSATLNFPAHAATPTVLFQHNVESILWQRQAKHEPNLLKRLAFKIEAAKMTRYEARAVGQFTHVIAVSDADRDLMKPMTEAARLSVVPTGVDLAQYRAAAASDSAAEPLVMFLGSMDWEANIDGVEYFHREIWPQVKQSVPNARFRVVGRNPHARIQRLAAAAVEVTGTVPSVLEHLRAAAVFVVPLRIGGGTRLKIYEAMALGKATVSTTIGAEGLDVNHGQDILLADDPASFAQSTIALLQDAALRQQLEQAAAAQAAKFDWPLIVDRFEEVLALAMRQAGTATQAAPTAVPVNA